MKHTALNIALGFWIITLLIILSFTGCIKPHSRSIEKATYEKLAEVESRVLIIHEKLLEIEKSLWQHRLRTENYPKWKSK